MRYKLENGLRDNPHSLNFPISVNRSCIIFSVEMNTVRLIWIAHFVVDILLLHHYKRDLAHLSDLYSLVIGMYKSERWAKKNVKWRNSSASTKFVQFWVVSFGKYMVKKYLISDRFGFLERFFFCVYFLIPNEIFIVFYNNWMVKSESVMLLSQNCRNEILKGVNSCTYRY